MPKHYLHAFVRGSRNSWHRAKVGRRLLSSLNGRYYCITPVDLCIVEQCSYVSYSVLREQLYSGVSRLCINEFAVIRLAGPLSE